MNRMREESKEWLQRQMEKMKMQSYLDFLDPKVDNKIRLKVPDIDRYDPFLLTCQRKRLLTFLSWELRAVNLNN